MHADIAELQEFYASRQGQLARRLIGHQLRQLWGALRGRTVVGLGYAVPFLPAREGAERALALLPQPAHAHEGHRLLQEYFAFPEKFLFVDVAGLGDGPGLGVGCAVLDDRPLARGR